MHDESPERWAEVHALWDETARWKASGEPLPFDLAARVFQAMTDPADRIEARAMLHVGRFYGDEIAAGILDSLADDEWWSTTPPTCAYMIERRG